MHPHFHIPEPCGENISSMKKCGTSLHCAVCKRDLLDLRKKDLDNVHVALEKNPGACVIVHDRHLATDQNRFFNFVNRFESFLKRYKMAALATVLIPAFLFLSGCGSRKKPHRVGKFKYEQQDQQ